MDEAAGTASVRSITAVNKGKMSGEALIFAHASFDVWSLGCILYQMCNDELYPLFQGGKDENLPDDPTVEDNLFALAEWSSELKQRKLHRVVDMAARNLLAQMLHKDPTQRASLDRVSHLVLLSLIDVPWNHGLYPTTSHICTSEQSCHACTIRSWSLPIIYVPPKNGFLLEQFIHPRTID